MQGTGEDRAWWRRPPRDATLPRTRWTSCVIALATVAGTALLMLVPDGNRLLPAVMLLGLAVSLLTGQRLGRVPPAMDVFDALTLGVTLVFAGSPLPALGIAYQMLWYRSLFGDPAQARVRAGLYLASSLVGTALWATLADGPEPRDLPYDALVAAVFAIATAAHLGRRLRAGMDAYETDSRHGQIVRGTAHRLLTADDASHVRQAGWIGMNDLVQGTPGLRAVRMARTADGFGMGPWLGPFPHQISSVLVPSTGDVLPDADAPEVHAALSAAAGEPCTWLMLSYPDLLPEVAVAVGHPQRLQPDVVLTAEAILDQVMLAYRGSQVNDEWHARAVSGPLTDQLTGLSSRAAFNVAVQGALRLPGNFDLTVLFLDLDDFRALNDAIGHAAGDDLLSRVADVLRSVVRHNDVLARLGGDEFALLLKGASTATAEAIADRIRFAVSTLMVDEERRLSVGTSIAVVPSWPGADLQGVLTRAEAALTAAKRQGKGRIQTWRPDLASSDRP